MAGVKSKLPQDITPMTAADRFLGSAPSDASAVVGYLASFAMTAFATVVAVAVDSEVTIPNLSLVFVVPVTIAGSNAGPQPPAPLNSASKSKRNATRKGNVTI